MRVVQSGRPPSQLERIAALEERDKAREEREQKREQRLESIETKLGELVDLLKGAKTIKALIDGGFKYVGYAASIGAAGVAIWKFFGH